MHCVVLVLALVVGCGVTLAHGDTCSQHSDGCSNRGLLNRFEPLFRPSCYRHDQCYRCGKLHSYNQKRCDDLFRKGMKESGCSQLSAGSEDHAQCLVDADAWYLAIRAFGELFYKNTNSATCSEDWVRGCIG